jgi:hypothetical protein
MKQAAIKGSIFKHPYSNLKKNEKKMNLIENENKIGQVSRTTLIIKNPI